MDDIKVETVTLEMELPSLNDVLAWAKMGGRGFVYAERKRIATDMVSAVFKESVKNYYQRAGLIIGWGAKSRRKDPDNIASGIKFILDGLVKAGALSNDAWKNIVMIHHFFFLSKEPRIQVTIVGE